MKRFFVLCTALSLATVVFVGCDKMIKTERKDIVTTPGGSTTTIDTHTVESSGDNPPANTQGERAN